MGPGKLHTTTPKAQKGSSQDTKRDQAEDKSAACPELERGALDLSDGRI